ncbi:MAG: MMPL family transporter [Bacteroidetes bacterium]|nr:RND family transporter [Bacteroidota bacterium]MBV6461313.1 hypothetical protein [Flavobacteriales bacterium]WKZ75287.1 MAG: MMPL family transporter [Vicingaceae bacterium]MCL4816554.1 MMPL family transporter [Flavobacteriales bacterium]NOG94350.1 MMPL family transporter [Bacteroidota bacterium]
MWAKLATLLLRNRLVMLICVAVITAIMGYYAQFARMSYQMAQVLPKTDSTFQAFAQFQQTFGKEGSVVVLAINTPDFWTLEQFNKWYQFTKSIETIEGVDNVISLANAYNLTKEDSVKKFRLEPIVSTPATSQQQVDSIKHIALNLPFYKGFLYADSSLATIMAITLNEKVFGSSERVELFSNLQKQIQQFEKQSGIEIHASGLPYIRAVTSNKISKEIKLFCLLAALVTAVVLLLFFRSFKAMLFSMVVVGIGVLWGVGFIGLIGYEITILLGLVPPLIIVIGIPNCVYLINKYHQEFKAHGNKIKALARVISKVGTALFMTNATTALGFATFIFTDSKILFEFGVVASSCVMMLFMLSLVLIPLIFSYLPRPEIRHTKHLDRKWVFKAVESLIHLISKKRRWVYVSALLVFALSMYGITRIKTTGRVADDVPHKDKVYTDLKFFENTFNGVLPLEIIIDTKKKNGALQLPTLKRIDELEKLLEEYPELSKPISVVDGVKFAKQAFYNGNPNKYQLFNNNEKSFLAPYLKAAKGNQDQLKAFLDSTKQITRVSVRMADVGTSKMDLLVQDLKPKIDSIFEPDKYHVQLTGSSVVFFKGTTYLVKNLFISIFIAIVLIACIMALLFSSFKMVLISLVPNLLPLITTAGLMGYFNIPLKPSTLLIFSIAFGISIDDTIHYLAKYRQELKHHNWNIKEATIVAIRETGVSMIYTSIILFFGFGVFTASDFGGTQALGLLVSLTLLFAMFSNLIILPSLLLSLDRAVITKSFKSEPLLQIIDEEEDIELDELEIKELENGTP